MKFFALGYREFFIGFFCGGIASAILYCVFIAKALFLHPQLFVDLSILSVHFMDIL